MSAFTDLLKPANEAESRQADIRPEFLQGRAAFGGLVAALGVRSMRTRVARERRLRSLLVSLAAPVTVGGVGIESRLLGEGGTASHGRATLYQNGQIRAEVMGTFGLPRRSPIAVAAPPAPREAPPESLPPVPFIPGLTPEFTQFFDYCWPDEVMPFSGQDRGEMGGWIRLKEAVPVADPFLVALADAWPTPALPMLRQPHAFSTLTWSIEVCAPPPLQDADRWWQVRSVVEQAEEGYIREETRIWTHDGRLALVSRQVVAMFAPRGGTPDRTA